MHPKKKQHLRHALKLVKGKSILTIGESENFIDLGGIINFLIIDGKVRFEIDHEAARRSNLKVSSDLLALAVNSRQYN